MAAVDRAACQIRMIAQDGIQRELVLTNERMDTTVLMPIRAKRKEFPGGYDKNARFSVKMLSVFCTPSSYSLDANASRGRARIFMRSRRIESSQLAQPLDVAQTTGAWLRGGDLAFPPVCEPGLMKSWT